MKPLIRSCLYTLFVTAIAGPLAACFTPDVPDGLACAAGQLCPDGQTCDVNNVCRYAAPVPDTVGPDLVPDAGNNDNDIDGSPEEVARCEGWQSEHFTGCDLPETDDALVLEEGLFVYDTDLGEFTTNPGDVKAPITQYLDADDPGAALVMVVDSLDVRATGSLKVVGARPLIIASYRDITVDGLINASSDELGAGAGTTTADCIGLAGTPGGNNGDGGAGGGGGAFGGNGGDGGPGGGGAVAGAGGEALAVAGLRAGCPGGTGGRGDGNIDVAGGLGGGAVHLSARLDVTINGQILANGSGGTGGHNDGGGAGGGAGGYIGIEGTAVALGAAAIVAANGGGGGGGTNSGNNGGTGQPGQAASAAAAGGPGVGGGAAGGNGGFGAAQDGATGGNAGGDAGSGGGGGGAGFIIITGLETATAGSVLSPSPELR